MTIIAATKDMFHAIRRNPDCGESKTFLDG